jgi:RNA-directed DNA polymerase
MFDRAMQALHLLGLEPVAESTSDPNSYGFRRNRSTADAMGQIFVCMSQRTSAQWALEADIQGCFDHLNHAWLVDRVRMNKTILKRWLKAGVVHKGQLTPTSEGTPQGGVISPTLANVALNGLEMELLAHLGAKLGKSKAGKLKINVVRYADDFIVTGPSKEFLETEVQPWIETFLAARGLRLSPEKTRITHIDDGFDFLGWNFRKYRGVLLIKPSRKNAKAFYDKVAGVIKSHLMVQQAVLIEKLNPILRGWAQYHQPVVALNKAEVVKANARSANRHRQPRSAGGSADSPHQRTDPPLQDPRQGPPWSPWSAAHGEPSPQAAGLPEVQGRRPLHRADHQAGPAQVSA